MIHCYTWINFKVFYNLVDKRNVLKNQVLAVIVNAGNFDRYDSFANL